jgi:hypothetical protein
MAVAFSAILCSFCCSWQEKPLFPGRPASAAAEPHFTLGDPGAPIRMGAVQRPAGSRSARLPGTTASIGPGLQSTSGPPELQAPQPAHPPSDGAAG